MQEKSVKTVSRLTDKEMKRLWFDAIAGLVWVWDIQQRDMSHLQLNKLLMS